MPENQNINNFTKAFDEVIFTNAFVFLSMGNYKGIEQDLKKILIKKVLIKSEEKLSFTYRYKTKDIVKNYVIEEGFQKIKKYLFNDFHQATLQTSDFQYVTEITNSGKVLLNKIANSKNIISTNSHNREKIRLISTTNNNYLHLLGITDSNGNVFKNTQDKYRQINHYIEQLSSLIANLPEKETIKVVDMGSGKGYLTFALYDYLTNVLGKKTEIIGVEFRKDMVSLCNDIAKKSGFSGLKFIENTIENFEQKEINVLIALHACDTATDDALKKGIEANAELIVVAPCCHKQIRIELEATKTKNVLGFLMKYGTFLEKQAEMLTDGIRALVLEYFGYKTKVLEFISDEHTPKNVMIIASKSANKTYKKPEIASQIKDSLLFFGVKKHYLVSALKINN